MVAVAIALIGFFAFVIMRMSAPQMTMLFSDLSLEELQRDHQGSGAADHPLRAAQRRRDHHGAARPGGPAAHEAGGGRPAQGRRRRLRDFRPVGHARRHQLRPERQPLARARRRTGPHHPGDRPRADGPRPSGAARAATVLARPAGGDGLDRAQGPRHARAAAGARHPPSRCVRRQRPQARAGVDHRRDRPAAGGRSAERERPGHHRRRAPARLRAPAARAGRDDRDLGGRTGAGAGPAHRRFRLQPRDANLRAIRSGRPRHAVEPDAGRILATAATARTRSPSATSFPAASAPPKTRRLRASSPTRPRKSSTTRFPARPRPK